jgi:sugar lactone lactonase YvrE
MEVGHPLAHHLFKIFSMNKYSELKPIQVLQKTSMLGEGPVWDPVQHVICWLDILNGIIHQYHPATSVYSAIPVHQMIGSVAVCNNGDFIAGLHHGFAFISRSEGKVQMITDPEVDIPTNRFNDGKCDPIGRFWAGTMAISEVLHQGNVYVLDRDLKCRKQIENVSISNGLAWSLDHKTLYYIDTPSFEVVAYDYNLTTGDISNKKSVIKINVEEDGYPDGMTIDQEGMLWIGHWDGWQVTRWNPLTAEKLGSIKVPAGRVTSCTFGGDNLDDLYITTARVGLTEEALALQPLAGELFVVKNCGFKGLPAFEFAV